MQTPVLSSYQYAAMPRHPVALLSPCTIKPSRNGSPCVGFRLIAAGFACLPQRTAHSSSQAVEVLMKCTRGLTSIIPWPHAIEVEDQPRRPGLDRARLLAAAGRALREVALHTAADACTRLALQNLPQLLAAQQQAYGSGYNIALRAPTDRTLLLQHGNKASELPAAFST